MDDNLKVKGAHMQWNPPKLYTNNQTILQNSHSLYSLLSSNESICHGDTSTVFPACVLYGSDALYQDGVYGIGSTRYPCSS